MKEIFNIIFSVDRKKLTEKAFTRSIAMSVFGIVFCMIALCSTTWAWYSKNIYSTSNTVYAANCDMSVFVQKIDGENFSNVEKSVGRYQLEKDVKYKISLKAVGSANSAYAIIKYKGDLYYTDQFEVFSDSSTAEEFTFILSFSEENISIEIYPCWGTSSRGIRDVYNGESYSNLQKTQKTAQTTQVLTTTQAPRTAQTPVTTAPVTTETPVTTAPVTTETPVTTTSQITATPQNSAPETTWAAETEKVLPEAEQIVE